MPPSTGFRPPSSSRIRDSLASSPTASRRAAISGSIRSRSRMMSACRGPPYSCSAEPPMKGLAIAVRYCGSGAAFRDSYFRGKAAAVGEV